MWCRPARRVGPSLFRATWTLPATAEAAPLRSGTGRTSSIRQDLWMKFGGIGICLIDGDGMCDLVKQFNFGIQTEIAKHITVDAGWFAKV